LIGTDVFSHISHLKFTHRRHCCSVGDTKWFCNMEQRCSSRSSDDDLFPNPSTLQLTPEWLLDVVYGKIKNITLATSNGILHLEIVYWDDYGVTFGSTSEMLLHNNIIWSSVHASFISHVLFINFPSHYLSLVHL
jgi:hypothetical protein